MSTIQDEVNAIQAKIMNHKTLSWKELESHFQKTNASGQPIFSSDEEGDVIVNKDYILFVEEIIKMLNNILMKETPESEKREGKLYEAAYATLIMVRSYESGPPAPQDNAIFGAFVTVSTGKSVNAWLYYAWAEEYPNDPMPGAEPLSKRDLRHVKDSLPLGLKAVLNRQVAEAIIAVAICSLLFLFNPISAAILVGLSAACVLLLVVSSIYHNRSKYALAKQQAKQMKDEVDLARRISSAPKHGNTATITAALDSKVTPAATLATAAAVPAATPMPFFGSAPIESAASPAVVPADLTVTATPAGTFK